MFSGDLVPQNPGTVLHILSVCLGSQVGPEAGQLEIPEDEADVAPAAHV